MPAPLAVTPYVHRFVNPVLIHLAGRGWFADLEHVGRRSGTVRHTPLLAFRQRGVVTVALTYGSEVQWLKNLRSAAGGRMRLGDRLLELGAPRDLSEQEGLSRMPAPVRFALRRIIRCHDFVELPVLAERPVR